MTRDEYLVLPDVQGFVGWLIDNHLSLGFNINIKHSRFVPGGLVLDNSDLTNIKDNYVWRSGWTDSQGEIIVSENWLSTFESLNNLHVWLNSAIADNDQNGQIEMLNACKAVLEWGGVRNAISFVTQLAAENELIDYFCNAKNSLRLARVDLNDINADVIKKYDSGLTKIHAIISDDGLPIYDSRVGAAIATLVRLYNRNYNDTPNLQFPVGAARGDQIRDPGKILLGCRKSPHFYTAQVSNIDWVKAQIKLGWILEEFLRRTELFDDIGGNENRMHALEATLFMIGYDLRCVTSNSLDLWGQELERGYIPTSYNFPIAIEKYIEYRQYLINQNTNTQPNIPEFISWWLENSSALRKNTIKSYCYPLRRSEFNLIDAEIDLLQSILYEPRNQQTRNYLDNFRGNVIDEVPTTLIDIFIVGSISRKKGVTANAADIIAYELTTRTAAANILIRTASVMGRHFGLLDENLSPTEYFIEYFG